MSNIRDIISESYKQATVLAGKPACWVESDGRLIWMNSILENMLDLDEGRSAFHIFEINPSINLLSWKKYWKQLAEEHLVKSKTTLITSSENIFSTSSTGFHVSHEGEAWCCLVYETPDVPMNGQLKKIVKDASAHMMKHTVDHAREMIFWIDREGNLIYVNNKVLEKTGYSRKEIKELKAWHISRYVQTPREWTDFFDKVKEKGEMSIETEQFRSDGGINHVDTVTTYINYEGNEYLFSIVLDVTKKKEREALLHKMKYSFDYATGMISWFDEDGKFIYTNQRMAEECGYEVSNFKNMYLWDVAPNVPKYKWTEIWNRFKTFKTVEPYETLQRRKDGSVYPVEVSGTHLEYQGKEYLFAMSTNITEKKKKQKELDDSLKELERLKNQLQSERNYLQQEITASHNFNEIITQNRNYRRVLQQMQRVADTDTTVLITGETGTGKELVARAIHSLSKRRDRSMVKVNCASLPANLIESELFGHEKGAFTGAFQKKIGRFEMADKGTIFLDEIGELPLELQAKMLRALQEGEFEPLGSTKTVKVDVRVIAATNRDLESMIEKGTFREDLYYRLNVFPIRNLPLRERMDDIPLLIKYFVNKYCKKQGRALLKVTQASLDRLLRYNFPGNVRELENLIERAIILSNSEKLNLDAVLPETSNHENKNRKRDFLSMEEMQRLHIIEALERTYWKVTGKNSASELLEMNGKTLASRMKKLNIYR
ncbi:MAG: sigma 54-interacting transcriptional regulator [Bacteroidota bacterium]